MSEEKEVKVERLSLEEKFKAIVGEEINNSDYPILIDKEQFSSTNTIMNAPYLLNKALYQSSTISLYIVNLLDLHIKNEEQLILQDEKEAKVYLTIIEELTTIRKIVNTALSNKQL